MRQRQRRRLQRIHRWWLHSVPVAPQRLQEPLLRPPQRELVAGAAVVDAGLLRLQQLLQLPKMQLWLPLRTCEVRIPRKMRP